MPSIIPILVRTRRNSLDEITRDKNTTKRKAEFTIGIIISIIKTIIMIGILVIIHEGGHFAVAKLCKIKVNEFSLGFGKKLFSKEFKGTKYSIRLIPLRRICRYGRRRGTIRRRRVI